MVILKVLSLSHGSFCLICFYTLDKSDFYYNFKNMIFFQYSKICELCILVELKMFNKTQFKVMTNIISCLTVSVSSPVQTSSLSFLCYPEVLFFFCFFLSRGQLDPELELKSHLKQMLPINTVQYKYMATPMIDHRSSCLLVYQC